MGRAAQSDRTPADRRRAGGATLRRLVALALASAALGAIAPATASAAAPQVNATWATEVTASAARLRGLVNTGSEASTYRFDYLPLSSYEANVKAAQDPFKGALKVPTGFEAKLIASATDQEAVQRAAGLAGDTTYRYRLVVKNAAGEDIGPERTITTQEASPSFSLPEGRGWELVSSIDKNGGEVARPESLFGGGVFQAAEGGGAITYSSASSFGDAKGAPGASQYLSTRSGGGWSTRNVTLPTEAGAFGPNPDGVPYRLFSPSLGSALALSEPEAYALLSIPSLASLDSPSGPGLELQGASEDLAHVVFSEAGNLYLRSAGASAAINVEPGETSPTPGAELAAQGANAISADGSRVYWTDDDGRLIVRDGSESLLVDAEGEFQTASSDGAFAFFTKAGHLYRYSLATESSTDLTPGGGVAGVLGASQDGTHAYFQDASALWHWHAGTITEVAAGAGAANSSSFPPTTSAARTSADGSHLAFLSALDITGYESGGFTELYFYSATSDQLLCASCNPTGVKPLGSSTIPAAIANGSALQTYKPRAMSTDAKRLFFDSEDALVPRDSNGEPDVYGWRALGMGGCAKPNGCIALISSGRGEQASSFLDASADGSDAFFLTEDSLVSADHGSIDVYDARVNGGFPDPPTEIPCFGDACQPLPDEPDDPTPGTQFIGSETNPKLSFEEERAPQGKKGKKHRPKKGKGKKHKGKSKSKGAKSK